MKCPTSLFALAMLFLCGCGVSSSTPVNSEEAGSALSTPGGDSTASTSSTGTNGVEEPDAGEEDAFRNEPNAENPPEDVVSGPEIRDARNVQPGSLSLGDPAPPLSIATWAKGDPVGELEKGKIYVVEFWATWCPPCKASMPHLSQLQKEYADEITVIGVTDETAEVVAGFMQELAGDKTWDETVTYRIGLDDQQVTTASYMMASGQSGIPSAFIVGKTGRIEWIGHPMSMDEPLGQIVAGNWDLDGQIAEFKRQQEIEQVIQAANRKLRIAVNSGDWPMALRTIDSLIERFPEESGMKMNKLALLERAERMEEYKTVASEFIEQHWEDSRFLNAISWTIATELEEEDRDLELAMKAAKQASDLTDDSDASILDTVARVFFEQGDVDQAIAWQKKAIAANEAIDDLKETLKAFEQHKRDLEAKAIAAEETPDKKSTSAVEELPPPGETASEPASDEVTPADEPVSNDEKPEAETQDAASGDETPETETTEPAPGEESPAAQTTESASSEESPAAEAPASEPENSTPSQE